MSSRSWLWAAVVLAATAGPAAAQPPSPLELVAGIREAGSPDLALEYLKEVEPKLGAADKALVPLEKARCLLDAAEEESDEGTRTTMVNEAKEGFNSFLTFSANHPRASEASLALARLTSIEAKAQLNRARRMDVPPKDEPGHDPALAKQKAELAKAQPLFLLASKRFGDAAVQIKAKLDGLAANDPLKARLTREGFDADLAAAINEYYLADTFVVTDARELLKRNEYLEKARDKFEKLAKGPPTSRTVWIGRAWMAEVLGDQGKPKDMEAEFLAILAVPRLEAEDGKRLVRFFQLRRQYLEALTENVPTKLSAVEAGLRSWLGRYGNMTKPTTEVIAARYYLAFVLQRQGMIALAKTAPNKDGTVTLGGTARQQFETAEKLYRGLSQTDHDYTDRSAKNRMYVVRRLLGEADKHVSEYPTFEAAQMAALIQMAKMNDNEKLVEVFRDKEDDAAPFWLGLKQKGATLRLIEDVKDRKMRVVALLERARELATERDTPADVTDNLLRLIYFYQITDQPHQAAILGEHVARTIRSTGGKGAVAGLMALNGYVIASTKIKAEVADAAMAEEINAAVNAARKSDRERAILVARFLDQKFPNDTATDTARHRLAIMLNQDGKPDPAFEAVVKIRPGYSALYNARQLEGFLASSIINNKEVPDARKQVVFRRAIGDLSRVAKPDSKATEDDVRGYCGCRLRLAYLYLIQNRADPETEKTSPGYDRALAVADELIGTIQSFDVASDKDKKLNLMGGLSLDGLELTMQGYDVRTRALYLRAKGLVDDKKYEEAAKVIEAAAGDVAKGQLFSGKIAEWAGGTGDAGDEEAVAKQKKDISGLASGVDKVRRDIVMVGFKLNCVKGDVKGAETSLQTLKDAGGGIEKNQESLELMARELAAQIPDLRKQGKTKEATDLGAGLALLLKEFTALKELTVSTIMFLGQTFYAIGEYDNAVAEFRKIKVPSEPDWDTKPLTDFAREVRGPLSKQIREYRFAQLYIAKSLRGAGKFDEAEKMLRTAIGNYPPTYPKQGYASGSLDFRKELATLHEVRGAALGADIKQANVQWGTALKEWTTLFHYASSPLKTLKPDSPPEEVKRLKSAFFDAYYEIQRTLATANTQLIKDPAKLASSFEKVGKSIFDLENINKFNDVKEVTDEEGNKTKIKVGTTLIADDVWNRYCDLIEQYPALKAAYKAAGGKFFFERPKAGG